MSEAERGFTLIETMVAIAILAILLAAGGAWMLGFRPGALAQATHEYDDALANARALAQSAGDGATLVFAPRPNGVAGFVLRVYAGRPNAVGAVAPTTAMPAVSDASVLEATLGAPPFALFLGASGHVSGMARYPESAANGMPTFTPLALEPSCPARGYTLTFTSPQGARATRTLPCTRVGFAPAQTPLPNPSPTPNLPLVTPPTLVYHWPADAEQRFVATEWGYTHWFAATDGLLCGLGIATFPDVLPAPYSPPYDAAEALTTPDPPGGEPYAYPNSGGASMNDAPATFRLDPAGAGMCDAVVADEFGQRAQAAVQVMGWLSASYGGKLFTHLTAPLAVPAGVLPSKGSVVTLALAKTFDDAPLAPQVAFDATCSPLVRATVSGGATPPTPTSLPATASVTLALVRLPGSPVTCGGVIFDQYLGSRGGEGVAFNLALGSPLQTWPPAVEYPIAGASVNGYDSATGQTGACPIDDPVAYDGKGWSASDVLDDVKDPWWDTGTQLQAGAYGCLEDGRGNAIDMTAGQSAIVYQAGGTGTFNSGANTCGQALVADSPYAWKPGDAAEPGPVGYDVHGAQSIAHCSFALTDDSGTVTANNTVLVKVVGPCVSGATCHAVLGGEWVTYDNTGGCAIDGGLNCSIYHSLSDLFASSDGGSTWSFVRSLVKIGGTGGAAPCAFTAPGVALGYTGGYDSTTGAITWSPTKPPGTTGIALSGVFGSKAGYCTGSPY